MSFLLSLISGEMETDEQDDESSQDQELPSENDNSQSEDSVGGDNELENGMVGPQNSTKVQQTAGHNRKRLFTFQFNNMGKTDFTLIKEDTRQIRFDEGHLRLSGQWTQKSRIQAKYIFAMILTIPYSIINLFVFIFSGIYLKQFLILNW